MKARNFNDHQSISQLECKIRLESFKKGVEKWKKYHLLFESFELKDFESETENKKCLLKIKEKIENQKLNDNELKKQIYEKLENVENDKCFLVNVEKKRIQFWHQKSETDAEITILKFKWKENNELKEKNCISICFEGKIIIDFKNILVFFKKKL